MPQLACGVKVAGLVVQATVVQAHSPDAYGQPDTPLTLVIYAHTDTHSIEAPRRERYHRVRLSMHLTQAATT